MIDRRYWTALRSTDPAVYQSLEYLATMLDQTHAQLGINPGGAPQRNVATQLAPPPAAAIEVTAQDGYFLIALTNPAGVQPGSVLLHELASATSLNFDAASGVTVYGPSAQLQWKIGDPNVTKYWRLRSKYLNSGFNAAQYAGEGGTCGPAALYSGLLRSASNALLNTANTPQGANPLTQSGTTSGISVAASVWTAGGGATLSYNSGFVDPGAFGTWQVYALDPGKRGGSVVYHATQNSADITANDGVIYFGSITTASSGGGSGGGGGAGPCGIAGAMVDLYGGGQKDIADLVPGDRLLGVDGGLEIVQSVTMRAGMPCFSLTTADGGTLSGASVSHKLIVDGGYPLHLFEVIAGAKVWRRAGPSAVSGKSFLGLRTVYLLELDRSRTYWLDGFASHNFQKQLTLT